MKEQYAWSRKSNDDIWHGGICHSVKECVEEARLEGYKDTDTFAIGYCVPYEVTYVDGDRVIEALQEQAYDEIGEVSEGWLDSITIKQREDLGNRLLKVVLEWLKDCKEEPTFYKVEPFDELTLQEALLKYTDHTEKENDMKVEMKINRYVKHIGKDDLILDNGSCIQVVTQTGAFDGWHYAALLMSKKLFNELKKFDLIYLDVEKTKKANKSFNAPHLFYFRFDIDKMIASGYKAAED